MTSPFSCTSPMTYLFGVTTNRVHYSIKMQLGNLVYRVYMSYKSPESLAHCTGVLRFINVSYLYKS